MIRSEITSQKAVNKRRQTLGGKDKKGGEKTRKEIKRCKLHNEILKWMTCRGS